MDLRGRSFITLKDFTMDELEYLIQLATELKEKKKNGIAGARLHGKNIALIFEKPSTRTRCAFTIGAQMKEDSQYTLQEMRFSLDIKKA